MVKALACDRRGDEFNSRPSRCQVTTLGKLFTHVRASVTKQYNLVADAGQRFPVTGKVTVGLASHWPWPCVTDFSGLSTYELKAYYLEPVGG